MKTDPELGPPGGTKLHRGVVKTDPELGPLGGTHFEVHLYSFNTVLYERHSYGPQNGCHQADPLLGPFLIPRGAIWCRQADPVLGPFLVPCGAIWCRQTGPVLSPFCVAFGQDLQGFCGLAVVELLQQQRASWQGPPAH